MKANKLFSNAMRLTVLALIIIWSGFPILLLVLSSFKEPNTIFDYPPRIFFKPTTSNYSELAQYWPEYFKTWLNSFIITMGAALFTVILSFFAGYAYSRFKSRFLTLSAFFMILVRMLPPIVISIPLYPVFRALGLFDKHITMIIFYSVFFLSLGTFLMKSFMDQIPIEMDESAFIDGASRFQVLKSIILPMSTHGVMATSTFVIIFAWKEYLFALLFTTTKAKTAPLIISEMLSAVVGVRWGPIFAAATLQLLPILIFLFLIQKILVEGVAVGSVKG